MSRLRTAGAVAFCAAAFSLAAPAIAHAGGTHDPAYSQPPAASSAGDCSDRAPFVGQWSGHGRGVLLNADGTGTITVRSGAANSETWTQTWSAQQTPLFAKCGVAIQTDRQTQKLGNGSYGVLTAGKTFQGALGQRGGHTVLLVSLHPGQDSIAFCRPNDYAPECGA